MRTMEKKYYDTIALLIKQNEKAAKCEPILDDIIQDVYEHSKVVLETVTNEDVINAYLDKVIRTSLITVPKKLNFDVGSRHSITTIVSSIVAPTPTVQSNLEVEEISSEVDTDTVIDFAETDNDLIDEEILPVISNEEQNIVSDEEEIQDNSISDDEEVFPLETVDEDNQELEIVDNENLISENDDFVEEDTASFEVFDDSMETEDVVTAETQVQELVELDDLNDETEDLELIENEKSEDLSDSQDVDKNLVDKMINGVTEDSLETDDLLEESIVESNDYETDDIMTLEEESIEELDELDELSVPTEVLEESQDLLLDSETMDVDSLDEMVDEAIVDEVAPVVEETIVEEPVSVVDDVVVENSIQVPDFGCFSYEPSVPDFDNEEICADLKEYDAKYPDKKLLQVCKLKYEENLSVSEIATQLGFSAGMVLDTLNDIIELVKE